MAEFLEPNSFGGEIGVGTRILPDVEAKGDSGFAAMGKPVPMHRKQAAFEHCKSMGLTDIESIMLLVGNMSDRLERDEPYEAMAVGMKFLDLTGVYRLMAVLLTAEKEVEKPAEASFLDLYD